MTSPHPLPLNPAQRDAVEHPGGALLVLAGAGSGKTRVLTARIAHLITKLGVAPQRIFAVTFTNKAAGEMRSRIAQLLGGDPRGLWIGTFHSLSARLLRREAPLLGFGPNFTIYDADDSEALVKRLLEARQLSTKVYPPRTVHAVISSAKNRMLTPEELGQQADTPLVKVAGEIFAALGPALKQANAMDFDDLLLHPLALFREHPERLAYWQDRFQHVLVDEFQDTNAAQYLLVKQLAQRHGNLCVVGDDDQAIYGWRGADVRHMLSFQNDFPGTKLVRLEQNYRSTQIILDAANGIIAENTARLGKTLFTEKKGGDPVTLLSSADERDEAEWLANEFARRAADGDVAYEGMAILYRTNAQSCGGTARPAPRGGGAGGSRYRARNDPRDHRLRAVPGRGGCRGVGASRERARAGRRRRRVGGGSGSRRGRGHRHSRRALPHPGCAHHSRGRGQERAGGHAAHRAHGEGTRVADRRPRGSGGWTLPTRSFDGAAGRRRRGATIVLRGSHARARKVVSLMGAHPVSQRPAGARGAVSFSRRAAATCCGGAEYDALLAAAAVFGCDAATAVTAAWRGGAAAAAGHRISRRSVAGRAALRTR